MRSESVTFATMRACPDGEGNWSQESDAQTVSQIRVPIRGEWPESFVKRICLDLEHPELVIDLYAALRTYTSSTKWTLQMRAPFWPDCQQTLLFLCMEQGQTGSML